MLYRDFMQKFRPLYAAPDAASGATDGAAAAVTEAAGSSPAADAAASPVAATVSDAPAAAAPAAVEGAAAPEQKSEPTLLEAAQGKPKPESDAAAAKPEAGAEAKKDEPAPADAAKPNADAKPKDDKSKDDAGKEEEAAKTDPETKDATADAPPAPIKYEAFKIPDGVKFDDKKLEAFSEIVGAKQLPQEDAQKLLDLYVAERQNDATLARAEQRKVWDTLNDTWRTELRNNPELGGNRLETTLSLAKAVVEEYLPADKVPEYMAHMRNNGMGNYLLHVQLLHNIGKAMNVFEDGIVPANPQAPKAQRSPGNRGWYDKSLNAPQ